MTFDLATYLIACARDCLDEPPLFAPRRMVEAAAQVAESDGADPAMRLLGERIAEQRGALLGMEHKQLGLWLDELVGELAAEARRRALGPAGDAVDLDAIADRFHEAYNRHDVDAVLALYAEDAEHHEVAQGRRAKGIEDIGSGLARFIESFPDCVWRERRRVISADAVALAYVLTGTLAAPMGPFRDVGASLELEGLHLLEVRGGRIVSSTDYWDASTFNRQMTTTA